MTPPMPDPREPAPSGEPRAAAAHEPYLLGFGGPALLLDDDGRVLDLSPAGAEQLGIDRQAVRGRPCHEAMRCQDEGGTPRSPDTCPIGMAIRSGRSPQNSEVDFRGAGGRPVRMAATAVGLQLPRPATLILLGPGAAAGELSLATIDPSAISLRDGGTLTGILKRLLEATGAAAVELFLKDPLGQDLVMAAQAGQAARVFRTQTRFASGEGFAGLVAETGYPLVSEDLACDERFLRQAVLRKGFRSYTCVPVWGKACVGSLQFAFRDKGALALGQRPGLSLAAERLGMAIELERLRVADRLQDVHFDPRSDLPAVAEHVLDTLLDEASAVGGAVLVPDSTGRLKMIAERGMPRGALKAVAAGPRLSGCGRLCFPPAASAERGGEGDTSQSCLLGRGFASSVCLPLRGSSTARAADPTVAVVVLGYDRKLLFPCATLSFLHEALPRAAAMLASGRGAGHGALEGPVAAPAQVGSVSALPEILDVRCLGPFRLSWGGAIIPPGAFVRRRSLLILKFLLAHHGRLVHRDDLIDVLSADSGEPPSSSVFNTAVHYLRVTLAPPGREILSFIRREGSTYCFDVDSPHRYDVREFQDAVATAGRLAAQGRSGEAIRANQRAIALYTGDFLADDPFSEWCDMERVALRTEFLRVLRQNADLHLGTGGAESAITCLRRALEVDPTLEDLHRDLMRVLWQVGRRSEALVQFQDCQAVLARRLDTVPMPETLQLRDDIANAR